MFQWQRIILNCMCVLSCCRPIYMAMHTKRRICDDINDFDTTKTLIIDLNGLNEDDDYHCSCNIVLDQPKSGSMTIPDDGAGEQSNEGSSEENQGVKCDDEDSSDKDCHSEGDAINPCVKILKAKTFLKNGYIEAYHPITDNSPDIFQEFNRIFDVEYSVIGHELTMTFSGNCQTDRPHVHIPPLIISYESHASLHIRSNRVDGLPDTGNQERQIASGEKESNNDALIVGMVLGIFLLICIGLLLLSFITIRRLTAEKNESKSHQPKDDFENIAAYNTIPSAQIAQKGSGFENATYDANEESSSNGKDKRQKRKAVNDYEYFEDCSKIRKPTVLPSAPDARMSDVNMHENDVYESAEK